LDAGHSHQSRQSIAYNSSNLRQNNEHEEAQHLHKCRISAIESSIVMHGDRAQTSCTPDPYSLI